MSDNTDRGAGAMKHHADERSLGEQVLASALWMGGWRWTERVLGLVSTVVIARLLLPQDLGIIATALVVIAMFDIFIELGTDRYLILLPSTERADYDTAWTLRLAIIAVASGVIFFSAQIAAGYFNDPRLAAVLRVLAVGSLLRGFTNIGLTIYRRDLRFARIALVGVAQRIVGFVVTVALAIALENYWAMVIGEVCSRLAEVALSYLVQPYRPRFSVRHLRKQWQFSKWIVTRNVAGFAHGWGDQFLAAKFFGLEAIGFFSMALRLAEAPTRFLIAPMSMPLYSGLAKKQHDRAQFERGLLQAIGATCVIILPAATLAAALAQPLVSGLFGAKWQAVVPLVAPLVFTVTAAVVIEPATTALILVGRARLLAMLEWISAIAAFSIMLTAARLLSFEQFAYTRMLLALLLVCIGYACTAAALRLSWRRLAACFYRPLIASAVMAVVMATVIGRFPGTWLTIALCTVLGGVTYVTVAYVLWRIAAAPDAGEALLVRKVLLLFGRKVKGAGT